MHRVVSARLGDNLQPCFSQPQKTTARAYHSHGNGCLVSLDEIAQGTAANGRVPAGDTDDRRRDTQRLVVGGRPVLLATQDFCRRRRRKVGPLCRQSLGYTRDAIYRVLRADDWNTLPHALFSAKATRVRRFRELLVSDEARRARTSVARWDARGRWRDTNPIRAEQDWIVLSVIPRVRSLTELGHRRSRVHVEEREGAAVCELVDLDLKGCPSGSRLICRRERHHLGAQLGSPITMATASGASLPIRLTATLPLWRLAAALHARVEAEPVTHVEILESKDLVADRDGAAQTVHDLEGERKAQVDPLGPDVEQQLSWS